MDRAAVRSTATAREGLESLIKTYRTLKSGLIYETRPGNPYAAEIQEALKQAIDELGKQLAETSGMQTLRDADVLARWFSCKARAAA